MEVEVCMEDALRSLLMCRFRYSEYRFWLIVWTSKMLDDGSDGARPGKR